MSEVALYSLGTRLVPRSETLFASQRGRRPRQNLRGVLCTVLKGRSHPETSVKDIRGRGKSVGDREVQIR